jgi:hypothetical protein
MEQPKVEAENTRNRIGGLKIRAYDAIRQVETWQKILQGINGEIIKLEQRTTGIPNMEVSKIPEDKKK